MKTPVDNLMEWIVFGNGGEAAHGKRKWAEFEAKLAERRMEREQDLIEIQKHYDNFTKSGIPKKYI